MIIAVELTQREVNKIKYVLKNSKIANKIDKAFKEKLKIYAQFEEAESQKNIYSPNN